MSEPLRVGVLVNAAPVFEDWELRLFSRLAVEPELALSAVLHDDVGEPPPHKGWRKLAERLDASLFARAARRRAGLKDSALIGAPFIDVAASDARIAADIVLDHRRGRPPIPPSLIDAEVWRCSPLDAREFFGWRETAQGAPVTHAGLALRTNVGDVPLAQTTTNTKFSAAFNAAFAKDALPSLVIKALRRRTRGVPVQAFAGVTHQPAANITAPNAWEMLGYGLRLAGAVLGRAANIGWTKAGRRPGCWSLFVGEGDPRTAPLKGLRELAPPPGEFWADPFLFEHEGDTYVFFEAYDYASGVGRLSVGRLSDDDFTVLGDVDLGPIHLSYPYVFAHGGEIYMMPETHQRDRVEIWRCEAFPLQWSLHATALDGLSPADAVLFQHKAHWWLFANLPAGAIPDHCGELHAFRVDGPGLRRIEPHRDNPVVLNDTMARNGGRPFIRDGALFRPSQNTSCGLYGYGLNLMQVTALSLDEYAEEPVRRVTPARLSAFNGCHHLDATADRFIIDARRKYGGFSNRWRNRLRLRSQ